MHPYYIHSLCPSTQSPHGLPMRHSGSPKFAVKTRQAFYLQATGLTRLARRVCQDMIKSPYLARHPYLPVNTAAIKAECERLVARPSVRQSVCLPCLYNNETVFI